MPKLSPAQQSQRRARILDAAEVCFARAGFHRTTMQDICKVAGVSAGAVYLYFASKEALIDGIVERDREEIALELGRLGDAPDLMSGLEGLLRRCVLERPAHKAALYIEMLSEANRNPHMAQAMRGCETVLIGALCDMLAQAQKTGRIATQFDPDTAARLLMLMGDGLFVLLARGANDDIARIVPELLAMIGRFLISPAGIPAEIAPLSRFAQGSPALAPATE